MAQPQPRARRYRGRWTPGSSLLFCSLLTAAACVASCWWYTCFSTGVWSIHLYGGRISTEVYGRPRHYPMGWSGSLMPPEQRGPRWRAQTIGSWGADTGVDVYVATFVRGASLDRRHAGLSLALWPLPLLLCGAGLSLRRSAKRAQARMDAGECPGCGYNRAGLAKSARCPECGGA